MYRINTSFRSRSGNADEKGVCGWGSMINSFTCADGKTVMETCLCTVWYGSMWIWRRRPLEHDIKLCTLRKSPQTRGVVVPPFNAPCVYIKMSGRPPFLMCHLSIQSCVVDPPFNVPPVYTKMCGRPPFLMCHLSIYTRALPCSATADWV